MERASDRQGWREAAAGTIPSGGGEGAQARICTAAVTGTTRTLLLKPLFSAVVSLP